MSLPRLLSIGKKTIPYSDGYIRRDDNLVEEWKNKLGADKNKKLIGIHWQGNPKFEQRMYSRGRSISVSNMDRLAKLENVEFVSLQKGKYSDEKKSLNEIEFVSGQEEFDKTLDFKITSAVIANCDYIITSDSSIAHLAGSMNIRTYLALSYVPEWRWLSIGEKTNWYKNMSLHRQKNWGEWADVLEEIVNDINGKMQEKTNN